MSGDVQKKVQKKVQKTRGARRAPCPVCGRPFAGNGTPCVLLLPDGFYPACGHCAAVLRAARVPSGPVLAGVLPDGTQVATEAFCLRSPEGRPVN